MKNWSQLIFTPMARHVSQMMDDPRLTYHNFNHVERIYALAGKQGYVYCRNLDCAILWHDSVYDELPDKELRSAEAMRQASIDHPEWFEGIDVDKAYDMIMNTAGHIYSENVDPRMIYLDLDELARPDCNLVNFANILQESVNLYGISYVDAALGSIQFMTQFSKEMIRNAALDPDNAGFWRSVNEGCHDTITAARTTLELYKMGMINVK